MFRKNVKSWWRTVMVNDGASDVSAAHDSALVEGHQDVSTSAIESDLRAGGTGEGAVSHASTHSVPEPQPVNVSQLKEKEAEPLETEDPFGSDHYTSNNKPDRVEQIEEEEFEDYDDLEVEPKLPWRQAVESPKEFFNTEILYRFDILDDIEQSAVQGTYRLELRGNNGGVWTLMVGKTLEVVNRREEADVVLSMSQKDFLNLVNGAINPQLAILGNRIKATGEARRVVALQSLLCPRSE